MQETWVRSLGGEDALEEEMATHSSILAWRILWTQEPGGLQSMGSQRVRRDSSGLACTQIWVGQWCPDSWLSIISGCVYVAVVLFLWRTPTINNGLRVSVLQGEKSSRDGWCRLQGDVQMCVRPLTHALENNSNGRFCYIYSTVIKKWGKR